jgi:hypothetical protein
MLPAVSGALADSSSKGLGTLPAPVPPLPPAAEVAEVVEEEWF